MLRCVFTYPRRKRDNADVQVCIWGACFACCGPEWSRVAWSGSAASQVRWWEGLWSSGSSCASDASSHASRIYKSTMTSLSGNSLILSHYAYKAYTNSDSHGNILMTMSCFLKSFDWKLLFLMGLTLPMLRLLSPKEHGHKDFWKPS